MLRDLMRAALAAFLCLVPGVSLAIGIPVELGTAVLTTGVSTTMTITTTADAPAGALLVVPVVSTNSTTISSVTDSAGNTYAPISGYNGSSTNVMGGGWVIPSATLPAGSTITVAFGGSLGRKMASALSVSGVTAGDLFGFGSTGSDVAPTFTTGTLGASNSLVLAWTYVNSGYVDTWTESAGFTVLNSPVIDTRIMRVAYSIRSSAAPVTYSATNSVARAWTATYASFVGPAAAAPKRGLMTLGVGE